jgi:CheY-like chemotaxis protein
MRKLLCVEDNEDNLYMLQLRFDVLGGYEVLSARDGAAGIAMAADGWEVRRRLKADPATRDIPIIALNADAMAGDREKTLATGCNDFDAKRMLPQFAARKGKTADRPGIGTKRVLLKRRSATRSRGGHPEGWLYEAPCGAPEQLVGHLGSGRAPLRCTNSGAALLPRRKPGYPRGEHG